MRNPLLPAGLAGIMVLAAARAANPPESRLTLWYDRPAQYWEEALPVGNGRIGAMVHGGVHRDHIQLNEERTTFTNLMDAHPRLGGTTQCFQIDGNFATTAAIAEMLLQSHTGEIELLPALPPSWKQGSVSGLRARGGYTVGLKWQSGALASATVQARQSGPCTVRARAPFQIGSERSHADGPDQVLTVAASAGQTYHVASAR